MAQEKNKSNFSVKNFILKNNTYLILLVLFIICSVVSKDFLTLSNLVNICQQYASTVIVSIGMLFVILTGGIDLSVGSIVAIGSVLTAYSLNSWGWGVVPACLISLLLGTACGSFTGFLVAKTDMAPFVASLAMMTMARGIAYMISNGAPIMTPVNTISVLGTAKIFSWLTWLAVIAVVIVIAAWFVTNYLSFGRITIAIGSNEEAVHLAGINTMPVKMATYAISGFCSAIGGIIACSRTGIGSPAVGNGLELDCIAACVIGGASLSGGVGSPVKTVVGVLVLALIGNIMNLLAVPSYPQDVIKGIIIIFAVLLQRVTNKNTN